MTLLLKDTHARAHARTVAVPSRFSDLHPFHGRENGIGKGCVTGHEFVGVVVEVGSEVGAKWLSDAV